MFLAQLWGPVMLAIGLGIFLSRNYYIKIYRDLEKAPFAALMFGMVAMAAGITQILFHNVWNTLPQIVVSLLGWATLLKGTVFVVWPHLADKGGDWTVDSKLVPAAGAVMLIAGTYLSWVGYFS